MLTLSATHQLPSFSLMTKEEEVEVIAAEVEVAIKAMKKVANKTLVLIEVAIRRGDVAAMTKEEVEAIVAAIKTKIKVATEVDTKIKAIATKATMTSTGIIRVREAKELTLMHQSKPRKTIDLVYY